MTQALTTREALADAIRRDAEIADHIRDARHGDCPHATPPAPLHYGIDVCSPCLRDRIAPHLADALLSSGFFARLVEDEALVERVTPRWHWDGSTEQERLITVQMLQLLATALSAQSERVGQ